MFAPTKLLKKEPAKGGNFSDAAPPAPPRSMQGGTGAAADRVKHGGIAPEALCRNFRLGICTHGGRCYYVHEGVEGAGLNQEIASRAHRGDVRDDTGLWMTPPGTGRPITPCINFNLGRCNYGNACKRLHERPRAQQLFGGRP